MASDYMTRNGRHQAQPSIYVFKACTQQSGQRAPESMIQRADQKLWVRRSSRSLKGMELGEVEEG